MRGPMRGILASLLLLLAGTASAQLTINYDYEDGIIRYQSKTAMARPPQILLDGSNHFLRITASTSDCDTAFSCPPASKSLLRLTTHYTSQPLLTSGDIHWTYEWKMRFPDTRNAAFVQELFQNGSLGEDVAGGLNGTGPVVRIRRRGGGTDVEFQISYNNEASAVSTTRTAAAGSWHTYKVIASWSHDPAVGNLQMFYDGTEVLARTNVDVTLGTDSNRTPSFVIGLYGNNIPDAQYVDFDDVKVYRTTTGEEPPPGPFVHPGLLNTAAEYDLMESRVSASSTPWITTYNTLGNYASYTPETVATLNMGSPEAGDGSIGATQLRHDCQAAYYSALQWIVTETQARADKSIEILNHVASTVTGCTGPNDNCRLMLPWRGWECILAAEILKHVQSPGASGWTSGAQTTFKNWLLNFMEPRFKDVAADGNGNNWDTLSTRTRMAVAVHTDNQTLYNTALTDARALIRFYVGDYGLAGITPGSGFTWETCRSGNTGFGTLAGGDLSHTQMGLQGLIGAAEIAKRQGDDLYGYLDPADTAGILKAVQYHAPWIGFNEGRSTATSSGWPCAVALNETYTEPLGLLWVAAHNHYGTGTTALNNLIAWLVAVGTEGSILTHYQASSATADTTDPSMPGSPSATALSATQIQVQWTASTDNVGVTGYRIDHCSTAACTPSTQLVLVSGTTLVYLHNNLAGTSLHRYRIRALDAAGNDSAQTATVEATTGASPPPPPVTGNTYYIATTGNDTTGDGSLGNPWATTFKGVNALYPGDTLFMRGGTYGRPSSYPERPGGSWTKYMTIRPYPGETVTWTGGSSGFVDYFPYYVWLQGEYDAATDTRSFIIDGCGLRMSRPSSMRFTNLEVKNCANSCVVAANDILWDNLDVHHCGDSTLDHGMYTASSDSIMRNSKIHHNTGYGLHLYRAEAVDGTCTPDVRRDAATPDGCGLLNNQWLNNRIYANGGGAIVLNTGRNNLFINNLIYDSDFVRFQAPATVIYHNTFHHETNPAGRPVVSIESKCAGCIFQNNIIYGTALTNALTVSSSAANTTVNHNLLATQGSGINPLFRDPQAFDYRLQAGSPAIDAGIALAGIVTQDYSGAGRPVNGDWDIGAYEFGGVVTCPTSDCDPPSVPAALTATRNSNTEAALEWSDSTGSPVRYDVYQCQVASGQTSCTPSTVVHQPTVSNSLRTGLTAGAIYRWFVRSVDAAGNQSLPSATVTLTMSTPVADITAPSVPTDLSCTAVQHNQITCVWSASVDNVGGAGVAGYRVRRCTGSLCTPSVQIDTTGLTTYTDANVVAETTYVYSVASFDAASPANVSNYTSPTTDITTPAAPVPQTIVLDLDNDTDNTGTNGATPTASGITFTTTSAQLAVGSTHAAVFDSASDRIAIPSTGFLSPTNLTIRGSFYADTAFPGGGVYRYLFAHHNPPYAQRIQIAVVNSRLRVGLGNSAQVNTDVLGEAVQLQVLYRYFLRIKPSNTYDIRVHDDAGATWDASGSFAGLTSLGVDFMVGNDDAEFDDGWRGSIDEVLIDNRVLNDAERDADCALYVPNCNTPTPIYDPVVISAGTQGDGVRADANTEIVLTFTGSTGPDPVICNTLSNWYLAYDQVREPILTCSINGLTGQLTVASPPASPNVQVGLTYLPTNQQLLITNNTVIDTSTGDNLEQRQWWCRRPGGASVPWRGKPSTPCLVPSPGAVDVQMDLIWVGTGTSPAQDYALFCDPTPGDAVDDVIRVGQQYDQYGSLPIRYASQGVSTILIPDGEPITPILPALPGITAVEGGTLRRQERSSIIPVLNQNERVEYRFALEIDDGLLNGTAFACALRPASTGVPLSVTIPAQISIGPAQFVSQ